MNNPQYVSLDYALFRSPNVEYDQNLAYDNLFDATIDAFVYVMEREGFEGIPVMVTEMGWPTAGGEAASVENALAFNGNIASRGLNNIGTPKRRGVGVEDFLFDENEKSGEEFEKHFGILGVRAYDINFYRWFDRFICIRNNHDLNSDDRQAARTQVKFICWANQLDG